MREGTTKLKILYTDCEELENKAWFNEKAECTSVHEHFELYHNAVI